MASVQLSACNVGANWRSELGRDMPSRDLVIRWNICKMLLLWLSEACMLDVNIYHVPCNRQLLPPLVKA